MNLRDQFALAAMQGMAAHGGVINAESCYAAADAMLEARGESPQSQPVTPITWQESRALSVRAQNLLINNDVWHYEQITAESLINRKNAGELTVSEILGWKNIQLGRRALA